jgi:hypothetical protein
MTAYRYEHFKASLLLEDWAFAGGARPGEPFPHFDLPTVAHGRVRSQELLGTRSLFLYFASVT